jgi:hypothetical protein
MIKYLLKVTNKLIILKSYTQVESAQYQGSRGHNPTSDDVQWSQCHLGDLNRAKGKESYPSLALECMANFNWRIMGVYGPAFGLQNDKEIVKLDPAVRKVSSGWLSKTFWRYYSVSSWIKSLEGMYLICDNGCLCWLTLIFPYTHVNLGSAEGYFSSNLESIQKDVEFTFGILNKRWCILHNGIHYRDIKIARSYLWLFLPSQFSG